MRKHKSSPNPGAFLSRGKSKDANFILGKEGERPNSPDLKKKKTLKKADSLDTSME